MTLEAAAATLRSGMTKQRRTQHPGVKIQRLKQGWVLRWREPGSTRWTQRQLDRQGITTARERTAAAVDKYRELQKQRKMRALGRINGFTPLEAACELYLRHARSSLRDDTVRAYRATVRAFVAWAEREGARTTLDLTPARLWRWRTWQVASGAAPGTVNARLRRVKTWLVWLRRSGLIALGDHELRDRLLPVPDPRERVRPLTPDAMRELLRRAARVKLGAFVPTLLLSGARVGEWRSLRSASMVGHGIELGTETKTHRPRTVLYDVSPALRLILQRHATRKPWAWRGDRSLTTDQTKILLSQLRGGGLNFTWQRLRQTCACYLVNAPGIYGTASIYRESAQLGHSVAVAEARYLGVVPGIPHDAEDLESAMGIKAELVPWLEVPMD